jgi:hypothetical protein
MVCILTHFWLVNNASKFQFLPNIVTAEDKYLHSGMKIFGFRSEKSEFPALEKCLSYFSNPDTEENG